MSGDRIGWRAGRRVACVVASVWTVAAAAWAVVWMVDPARRTAALVPIVLVLVGAEVIRRTGTITTPSRHADASQMSDDPQ